MTDNAHAGSGSANDARAASAARRPAGVVFRRTVIWAGFAGAAALAAGFVWFVAQLSSAEAALTDGADGIVVLTGGSSRVSDGMDLLAERKAQRLLISGVHSANSRGDISRAMPEHQQLLSCCVDLGRFAINTRGNAAEARRWVEARQFRSLIVVTSNYHMPRAIAEFSHTMPGVKLIPYPVVGETWRSEPWWTSGAAARLLALEYAKFLVAGARIRLSASGLMADADASGLSRAATAGKNPSASTN
jgi:uncharacterized SAM-binding protein YcdF (DUF218 family)